ncbi:hypothetical protein HYU11_00020 [Candidatus Woesearchaeota archaeon]|nr:hypothetical protein [Candidatus Woesearchaeota archaeon]
MIKKAGNAWKKFADIISTISNTILLTAIYIICVTPIFLARKLARKQASEKTYWKDFNQEDAREELKRQF